MSRARWMLISLALAALERGAPAAADEGEGLPPSRRTLAECLEATRAHSQRLKEAAAVVGEAEADRRVARGRFGPVVRLEASAGRFDSPYSVSIPLSIPGVEVPPIQVRGRATAQVSASLVQPIGSLWTIAEAHRAQELGEQAAKAEQVATRNDVALEVAEAYVQALEAESLQQIADAAVRQIEAHLEQARQLQSQEVVARREVLKAEVGLGEAQSALAQARAGGRLARLNLAFKMGLPASAEVWPAPISEVVACETRFEAIDGEGRPELAVARRRFEQAQTAERLAWSRMLPELNAVASAQHTEGIDFQPKNAWYVGGQLAWNLWEWGATYYGVDAARARTARAEAASAQAREGLELERASAQVAFETETERLRVARVAVGEAEEEVRIVEQRFANQSATGTEVLDAVTSLARARARESSARHALCRARFRLIRAGEPAARGGEG